MIMTFKELEYNADEYFKKEVWGCSTEWLKEAIKAAKNGATAEELNAIPDPVNYNVPLYDGCDIINAFNAGYWLARKELGLPKCD